MNCRDKFSGLKQGARYKVVGIIKTHTKPLKTEQIFREGIFKKETDEYLIFNFFRVKKSIIANVERL